MITEYEVWVESNDEYAELHLVAVTTSKIEAIDIICKYHTNTPFEIRIIER